MEKFWEELKRRNVLRVCLGYLLVGLNLLLLISNGFGPIEPGEGFYGHFYIFLFAGLVFVGALAWTFERTQAGVVLEEQVNMSKSFAPSTGKKLNRAIIVLAVLAAFQFIYGLFIATPDNPAVHEQTIPRE